MASVKPNYAKDGKTIISYRFRACIGRDAKGKQEFVSKTVPAPDGLTPAKALKKLQTDADNWEDSVRRGFTPKADKTFRAFIDNDFLPVFVRNRKKHSPSTMGFYEDICARLVDWFGNRKLNSITRMDCDRFLTELANKTYINKQGQEVGYKPSYISHHRTVLKVLFGFAEMHELIQKNPMRFVAPIKQEHLEVDFLDEEEAKQFLLALKDHAPFFWRVAMNVFVYVGLRRGELAGLQWGDIDFENVTMRIRHSVINNRSKTGSRSLLKDTKTDASHGVLPIPYPAFNLLEQWKKEQTKNFGIMRSDAFVFPSLPDVYEPIRPDSITQWLDRFCNRFGTEYGFHKISPHDLRHTTASLLHAAGCSVKEIQMIMRHSDASTTMKYYTGVSEKQLKSASSRLTSLLTGND
jgi:Site-specific recombinase XerD